MAPKAYYYSLFTLMYFIAVKTTVANEVYLYLIDESVFLEFSGNFGDGFLSLSPWIFQIYWIINSTYGALDQIMLSPQLLKCAIFQTINQIKLKI